MLLETILDFLGSQPSLNTLVQARKADTGSPCLYKSSKHPPVELVPRSTPYLLAVNVYFSFWKPLANDDLNSNFNNIWLIDAGALDHRRWKSFNLDKEAEKLMCEACSEETQKADEKQITR